MELRTIKLLLITGVLFSCDKTLDLTALQDFQEVSEGQEWYYKNVITYNLDKVQNLVQENGNRADERLLLDELSEVVAKYNELCDQLEKCEEIQYDENFINIQRILIDKDLQESSIQAINQWLESFNKSKRTQVSQSTTSWLLLKISFNQLAFDILNQELAQVYRQLTPSQVFYQEGNRLKAREYLKPPSTMMVNNTLTPTDSLGLFRIDPKRPATLKWQFDNSTGFNDIDYTLND